MTLLKIISTLILAATGLAANGQHVDSVQLDIRNLSDLDFFKKYSFYEEVISKEDIKVTKLVWSLSQLKQVDRLLRQKGIRTFTRIDNTPSNENPYYIIGHYQLSTPDHFSRLSYYRVHILTRKIDYQNLDDFANDKWRKVE